jgi:peptide-methionine (S)-S-oxide reductase
MLDQYPDPIIDVPLSTFVTPSQAVLAGGCFWCVEAVYEDLPGVSDAESGYAGGTPETANYEAVCSGRTRHAEAVRVSYDASKLTFGQLLKAFFFIAHDPTTLNRQGNDVGPQYRSTIFYENEEQKRIAEAYVRQIAEAKLLPKPIVTTLEPLEQFYPAEAYHQGYAKLNPMQPYIFHTALPKVEKLRKALKA